MGVPLLLTWLRKRFTSCFIPANSKLSDHILHPDNLYVDLNSFLYQAASIVENLYQRERSDHSSDGFEAGSFDFAASSSSTLSTEEIESLVLDHLYHLLDDVIFQVVQPVRLVYIAVDGVSPLGKLAQQRSRRHRRAGKPPHSTALSRHGGGAAGVPFASQWDSNCISVGTKFMHKAAQALHQYAVMRTESVNLQRMKEAEWDTTTSSSSSSSFIPIVFVVDDVFRPGEGETKISEAIRRFRLSSSYDPNTSHVICSSDTDVTVTSLLLHDPHIHVLRYEPPPLLSAGGGGGGAGRGGRGGGRGRGRGGDGRGGGGRGYHGGHFHTGNASSSSSSSFSARGRGTSSSSSSFSPRRTDPLTSTFFSIHLFREALRELLSLSPPSSGPHTIGSGGNAKNVQEENENDDPPTASLVSSTIDPLSPESHDFEKSLHDIVFLLLLFGNDFLPSVSGSIQEGTLDALLTLLAEDFVPRQRYIVDSATNLINFDAARYLLTRLLEIRQDFRGGRLEIYASAHSSAEGTPSRSLASGSLSHSPSASTEAPPSFPPSAISTDKMAMGGDGKSGGNGEPERVSLHGGVPSSWGYQEDPEFQRRTYERERAMRKKCYCYWTMLQWALHYSAGEVKHWGCYYPFSLAPPLDKLSEYCGVISYPQLRTFADRQASSAASSFSSSSSSSFSFDGRHVPHAGERIPSTAETYVDGMEGTSFPPPRTTLTTPPAAEETEKEADERGEEEDRGEPTDVLVQLLVLLPPQSAPLLPTRFQHCYGEIERMVNAPMEHIDFNAVLSWCETHEKLLSESDQTRFLAYRFLSHSSLLYAAAPTAAVASGVPSSVTPARVPLRSRDVVFMASWNTEAVHREIEQGRCLLAAASSTVPTTDPADTRSDGAPSALPCGASETSGTPPVSTTTSLTRKWGALRFPSARGGMKSSVPSAAAAAVRNGLPLLSASLPTPPTTPTRAGRMEAKEGPDGGVSEGMGLEVAHENENKRFPHEESGTRRSTETESGIAGRSPAGHSTPSLASSLSPVVVVVRETPSFTFRIGPLTLLGQELLQKSMGRVDGYHFLIHDFHASSSSSTSGVLSRHADTHQTRLLWELATTIEDPKEKPILTGLLPGVVFPHTTWAVHRKRGRSAEREEGPMKKHCTREMEGTAPLPPSEACALSTGENEQEREEEKEEKGGERDAAPAILGEMYPTVVAAKEEKEKEVIDPQMRREALRRRLEMLKNAAKEG